MVNLKSLGEIFKKEKSCLRPLGEFKQCYSYNPDRCDVPLGIRDGRVTRAMFTASSMYNHYYGPWSARLQAQNRGSTKGGWLAKYRNTRQWLQIDLGATSRVKRIATQGRYDANQWVKSYTVSYSNNGVRFYPYKHGRRVKVSECLCNFLKKLQRDLRCFVISVMKYT